MASSFFRARSGRFGARTLGTSLSFAVAVTALSMPIASPALAAVTISSPGQTGANAIDQKKTIEGITFVDNGSVYGAPNLAGGDTVLPNVPVAAYWMDEDGAISPTYTSTSDANGHYSILMQDWTDANGKVHTFDANAVERLKISAGNVSGYHLSYIDQKNALTNSVMRDFDGWVNGQVDGLNIGYQIDPPAANHLPAAQQTQSAAANAGDYGTVSGRVFADMYSGPAFITFPNDDGTTADPGLSGIKVTASWKDASGKIVETKYAYTDAQGRYVIKFDGANGSGTWSLISNTWNTANAFVSIDAPAGSQYASMQTNGQFSNLMAISGVTVLLNKSATGLNFAFKVGSTIAVQNYNTTTTPALPGATVTSIPKVDIATGGVYSVKWVDSNGTVVKTCTGLTRDPATGNVTQCAMTVPASLTGSMVYTAQLIAPDGQTIMAADSFLAQQDTTAPVVNAVPNQSTAVGTAISPVTITSNDPSATYTATGLPAGLTINPATGVISGTPTTPGTSTVTVRATDPSGNASAPVTFTWTMPAATPPVATLGITPIGNQTAVASSAITPIAVQTTDPAATVTVSGLPAGVTYDPATKQISGTPATPGSYPVTVTATTPDGQTSTETFVLTVNPPADTTAPAITPVANQTVTQGTALSPVAVQTNDPTATIAVSGLPAGVTYDPATKTISGTPTNTGSATVTITATDAAGNVSTETFIITTNPAPDTTAPVISTIADQAVNVGAAISPVTMTVNDPTATIAVTGLPAGVTYDPATKTISGAPTAPGTSVVRVTATDPAGNASSQTFAITARDVTAPVVTPIGNQTVTVGNPITPVTVQTDDPNATISVSGLPAGVTYDPATKTISGAPTAPGASTVTITATDAAGNASTTTFTITSNAPADTTAPTLTPVANQTVQVGTPLSPVTLQSNDPTATFTVTGLPAGVTYDPATKTISGAPSTVGSFTVTVTASDPAGNSSTESFVIGSTATPDTTGPTVTPIANQTVPAGTAIAPVTVQTNDPTATITVSGLPAGVTYNPATNQISGTPTSPGTSTVTVTATDPAGNVTSETFVITAQPPADTTAPTITPIANQSTTAGQAMPSVTVQTNDPTASIAVSGLPAGVSFNPATGVISGTPTVPGDSTITVTATDPAGNASETTFVLHVAAPAVPAPTVTPVGDHSSVVGQPIAPITVVTANPSDTVAVNQLPAGLVFDPATKTISGTPTVAGPVLVTVTATNSAGVTSTDTFTYTVTTPVDRTPPAITPLGNVTEPLGVAIAPIAVKTDDPTATVTVTGLPAGLSYNPATGAISGTPTLAGQSIVTVTATDPAGNTKTETFIITVPAPVAPVPPAITPIGNQVVTTGTAITPVKVVTNDGRNTIAVSGLPAGVTFDPATATISGTPTNPGSSTVTVTGTDATGKTATETFVITANVPDTTAPVIPAIGPQTGTVGTPVAPVTVKTDDPSAAVAVTGLPGGVTFNPQTGTIAGAPTVAGTFTVTVTAVDRSGNTSTQQFTLTVAPATNEGAGNGAGNSGGTGVGAPATESGQGGRHAAEPTGGLAATGLDLSIALTTSLITALGGGSLLASRRRRKH